jgi:hypothetical protein
MKNPEDNVPAGYHVIYVRWITRKGVRVYPPNGHKAWRLVVRDKATKNN